MKPDLESETPRYKTVRELGRGEHTLVELIYDTQRELLLARKSWARAGAELRFRLRQQYQRALGITHPSIVRMYDLVIEGEQTALIMEAVDGREVVPYLHALTLAGADTAQYTSAVLHVLGQLYDALSTLHAAGVVHRDVKPRNLLVESSGRGVLLDAGFSWPPQRHFDAQHDRALAAVIPYLAPECLRGALPSVEADWYSFGALAYELLTSEPPFAGSLQSVLRDKDDVSGLSPQLTAAPPELAELVIGLLARDPHARPGPDQIWSVLAPLCNAQPFLAQGAEPEQAADSAPPGKPSHMQLTAAGRAALATETPTDPGDARALVERTFPAPDDLPSEALPALDLDSHTADAPAETRELHQAPALETPGESPSPVELIGQLEAAPLEELPTPPSVDAPDELVMHAPLDEHTLEPAPETATASALPTPEDAPDLAPQAEALPPEDLDPELSRLAQLALHESGASLTCLRGGPGAGKSERLARLRHRLQSDGATCVLSTRATDASPLATLADLASQLRAQLPEACRHGLQALPATRRAALYRLCPQLFAEELAPEGLERAPQQQLIDALIGLRQLCLQLSTSARLVVCIDDVHALDADSAAALRALLCAPPLASVVWLVAQSSELPPREPFASLLGVADHMPLPVRVHELDPLGSRPSRTSYVPARASDEQDTAPPSPEQGALELAHRAELASARLALQNAASLYQLAVERAPEAEASLLEAAARAHVSAGNLRAASKVWLQLARGSRTAAEAQRFELEAGSALLRAGDEDAGRAVMRSVLRGVGLHWPRAPLLTSTLERVRVLLQSREPHPDSQDLAARALRFDALWGVAKELLLLAPASGDALSVRALREALALGDPGRLALALGYEATSEANIGGAFMQRRAAALSGEASELAARAAHAYDRAYARSVAAVVTWFTGDWADAESLLRGALAAYADVSGTTTHERDVLQSFLVGALEAQGKIAELRDQLAEQRISALATGHRVTGQLCDLADAGLPALAEDRALSAIARADALLAEHPSEGFTPLHFQHFVVTTSARLYAGHHAQAYQQVEQTWQRVRHSYLPQLDAVAVMLHQLRARAALALAAHGPAAESERLRKQARKLATSLGHSNLAHALALRHVVEANLAALDYESERADHHARRAEEIFDAADMTLMREVASHARAGLREDDDALRAAELRMTRLGVRVPSAFSAAWFPALRQALARGAQLA